MAKQLLSALSSSFVVVVVAVMVAPMLLLPSAPFFCRANAREEKIERELNVLLRNVKQLEKEILVADQPAQAQDQAPAAREIGDEENDIPDTPKQERKREEEEIDIPDSPTDEEKREEEEVDIPDSPTDEEKREGGEPEAPGLPAGVPEYTEEDLDKALQKQAEMEAAGDMGPEDQPQAMRKRWFGRSRRRSPWGSRRRSRWGSRRRSRWGSRWGSLPVTQEDFKNNWQVQDTGVGTD